MWLRSHSTKILSDRGSMRGAADPLHIHYTFQLDARVILPAQAIKLSSNANSFTAIVRLQEKFSDFIKSLLSYIRPFKENHGMCIVAMLVIDIVVDIISSGFLAANSRATYVRYIRVGKIMIKPKEVLPLIMNLDGNAPVVKTLGITHIDYTSRYISSEEKVILMYQAIEKFIEINTSLILSTQIPSTDT